MLLNPDWLHGPSTGWVVVNTHPHRERIALENLARQHFTTYGPTIIKRVRHARKVQDVPRPLFPGYVFVQVKLDTTLWRPMLSTPGVRSVVRCGERLSFIDNSFIDSLKSREVDGHIIKPTSPYMIGQQIRISGGPFEGLVATIIELDEKNRLVVLMQLLNGRVRVKVDASSVCELLQTARH